MKIYKHSLPSNVKVDIRLSIKESLYDPKQHVHFFLRGSLSSLQLTLTFVESFFLEVTVLTFYGNRFPLRM